MLDLNDPHAAGARSAAALLVGLLLSAPASAQCNTLPVAVDDTASYAGGPVLVVDVLANDAEPDGEALTVDNLTTTCDGTVSEDLGLVTLAVASFSGKCTLGYRITDERGGSATATVAVDDGTDIFADGFETGDVSRWSAFDGVAGR